MEFVHPSQIGAVWPMAEPLLLSILAKTGEEWTPAHVRAACEAGGAAMFVAEGSLVVAVARECEFTGRRELFVWCAAGDFPKHVGWFMQHARENGFSRLGFDSPRKGWRRRFKEGQTYYYAEVMNEQVA